IHFLRAATPEPSRLAARRLHRLFGFLQRGVVWGYIGEVFPNQVRAKGQSLGSFSHWFMNGAISLVFPKIAHSSGAYPFVFFSVMMVVQLFVVGAFYPET